MKIKYIEDYFKLIIFSLSVYSSNINAKLGGDFTLLDYNNNKYTLSSSPNVKVVFFGFLNCPDICPTALSDITKLLKKLKGLSKNIDPIFITVDPERDTPVLIKNYLTFFDERIIGLTGTNEQIEKVANQYHVYFSYLNKDKTKNYTVNHTANIYILDKKNMVIKIIIPGTPFSEFYKYINRYLMRDIKNLPLE